MRFEHTTCNLCSSNQTKALGRRMSPSGGTRLDTNIVRCPSCSLIYPDPMPKFEYNELQGNFDDPIKYFSRATQARMRLFERALDEIEKVKPKKGSILDIGCGRGEFLYVASKRNWKTAGTDISESFVRYARERFNVNALVGDLKYIEFAPESFDAVSLISVIQYLQDPMGTLKKINALLKKDGVLYIEVTNEDALVFKIGDFFKTIKEKDKMTTRLSPTFPSYQIYGFNRKSLSIALRLAGFEVSSIAICGFFGGGKVEGHGLCNIVVNFVRKIIILIGGLSGNGHLIYCIARKV